MLLSKDISELPSSDLHNSFLCGEEIQPASLDCLGFFSFMFHFPGFGSLQAFCLQKVLREGQVHNKYFLA